MTDDSSDINQGIKSEILDIPAAISVSDLADLMDVNPVEVVKGLMRGGYMFAVNDVIEHDIASVVVQIFGFKAKSPTQNDKTLTSLSVSTEDEDPKDSFNYDNLIGKGLIDREINDDLKFISLPSYSNLEQVS